ncbi:hypothetical protein C9J03_22470 [Photobacterium gaetbulicola]|uniref:Uncharacterized protein n=1 Tax=Photobacterium gaetbulicola Gung47 TaxID=658445 RepID=A0A0C5WQD8_9GAMM|nr:hypothetical protein [Photobacterium gaetbulicola]AJR08597.1 hypothetical protein H744_2c1933 [Photobacterium gaetbulicola Gung47]PSU02959.1 hypothetical protein C9J03_22470 [Photobacterium gaetbulicola]
MNKIIKLSYEGKDFGYMGMKKNGNMHVFYGGADKSDAVEFKQVEYPKRSNAYYYEVVKVNKHYLDIKATSSVLFADKPSISLAMSSIVAWEEVDGELHAIISGKDTTKAVSRSAADPDSTTLYGNLTFGDGNACKVKILDAEKVS